LATKLSDPCCEAIRPFARFRSVARCSASPLTHSRSSPKKKAHGANLRAMPWEPLPHEADLFCNVYVDESSQTKHRYLVLGGLLVPLSHAAAFEADIIAARDATIPIAQPDGTPRIIKWEKANSCNLASYKKVVDAFFTFPTRYKLPVRKTVDINCVAVDLSKKDLRSTGDGDVDIGFNKEVYFLCTVMIGKRFKKELFHIYPDRRTTKHSLNEARKIMNYGARKYGDKRVYPYRRLRFEDPEKCQALQVVDIFIGAIAYRLNGHYDKPEANKAKKELCDFILNRARIANPFEATPYYLRRLQLMHRDGSAFVRER
jgi:hypothetical protein